MFENDLADDLVELDAASTLAAAEANEHTLITAETRRLEIAAHWADLHPGDAVPTSRLPGAERPIRVGGEGTPSVAGFCPAELGCVLRISDGAAAKLIADALDLRHRLRLIWAAMLAGQVPAYQARHIATATRHLSFEQAAMVDQQLAGALGGCRGPGCTTYYRQPSCRLTQTVRSGPPQPPPPTGLSGWAANPSMG